MASGAGPRATGTAGSDFQHRVASPDQMRYNTVLLGGALMVDILKVNKETDFFHRKEMTGGGAGLKPTTTMLRSMTT